MNTITLPTVEGHEDHKVNFMSDRQDNLYPVYCSTCGVMWRYN